MSPVSPQDLIAKAERAIESSRLLQSVGDIDGACNRAYYAMFDAAKAALMVKAPSLDQIASKTHNGMIAAFGMHLVKTGYVSVELGRAFNRAQNIRQVADYTGDLIAPDDVGWLVQRAADFVQAMKELCDSR